MRKPWIDPEAFRIEQAQTNQERLEAIIKALTYIEMESRRLSISETVELAKSQLRVSLQNFKLELEARSRNVEKHAAQVEQQAYANRLLGQGTVQLDDYLDVDTYSDEAGEGYLA